MKGSEALKRLRGGNQRFVNDMRTYPHQNSQRLQELAEGQYPFATILSCSDSRVPPEHIFDVGLGDLFVVRVAGNVCGKFEIGSLEYAIEHLSTSLLVVMGHTSCGAVRTAVQQSGTGRDPTGILSKIAPVVTRTRQKYPKLIGIRFITSVIYENIWQSTEDILRYSSVIRDRVRNKNLDLAGALYDIENGSVEWLIPLLQPEQLVQTSNVRVSRGNKIPLWRGRFSFSSRFR